MCHCYPVCVRYAMKSMTHKCSIDDCVRTDTTLVRMSQHYVICRSVTAHLEGLRTVGPKLLEPSQSVSVEFINDA